MPDESHSAALADALRRAASLLAACSRPAFDGRIGSTDEHFASALGELVMTAELFSCKPAFWHCAAEAADLLGRTDDASKYRQRAQSARE